MLSYVSVVCKLGPPYTKRNAPDCCCQASAPARTALSSDMPGRSRLALLTTYGICGWLHAPKVKYVG